MNPITCLTSLTEQEIGQFCRTITFPISTCITAVNLTSHLGGSIFFGFNFSDSALVTDTSENQVQFLQVAVRVPGEYQNVIKIEKQDSLHPMIAYAGSSS